MTNLLDLIAAEQQQLLLSQDFSEKTDRINNIIQLKIEMSSPDLKKDIYVDVKKFINFYIKSFEEKQFNYDVFNEEKIYDYINLFDIYQKCSLLKYTIRHLKMVDFEEKVAFFETKLRVCELFKELKNLGPSNFFKVVYLATVYNNLTIALAILLCVAFKIVVYLPAPFKWMEFYKTHYSTINSSPISNHIANVLISYFDSDTSSVEPITFVGAVFFVIGKCLFILIVLNILIDQLKNRFKV